MCAWLVVSWSHRELCRPRYKYFGHFIHRTQNVSEQYEQPICIKSQQLYYCWCVFYALCYSDDPRAFASSAHLILQSYFTYTYFLSVSHWLRLCFVLFVVRVCRLPSNSFVLCSASAVVSLMFFFLSFIVFVRTADLQHWHLMHAIRNILVLIWTNSCVLILKCPANEYSIYAVMMWGFT